MDGEARSTFLRNRIGFCVLHPMRECAGTAARIEHTDGTLEEAVFPFYIAPQRRVDGQIRAVHPFEEMQALSHEVMPGVWAETRFAGDVFEMEDQRNWIDASYKSYSTPLRLTFPAEIKAGTRIEQSITVAVRGAIPRTVPAVDGSEITFRPDGAPVRPLPRRGLGSTSHGQPLTARELERLSALNLSHLRVDLRLSEPGYEAVLRQAWSEAQALGIGLEAAVFVSDAASDELRALLGLLQEIRPKISQWLIFHVAERSTSERWISLAREILCPYDGAALLGGGTNQFFTDLNRERPPTHLLDLIAYSINPQVHAFDNTSLTECLETIPATIDGARQFSANAKLAISPVTFKARSNPGATALEPELAPGELPPQVDVRQMSLYGAAWTLGCLKYVAESGLDSVTFFETSGWRGVMETEHGSPVSDKFHSLPGSVFPLYHVLADAAEFVDGEIVPYVSSAPLRVNGMMLRKGTRTRLMLANFTAQVQRVSVQGVGEQVAVRDLDETNVEKACTVPETFRALTGVTKHTSEGQLEVSLRPFAVVRIDFLA
jgi:D-apionolactonase